MKRMTTAYGVLGVPYYVIGDNMVPPAEAEIDRLNGVIDSLIAFCWKNNLCPHGMVEPGQPVRTCPAGYPGCACADAVVRVMPDELCADVTTDD